jgi:hypothetical protein
MMQLITVGVFGQGIIGLLLIFRQPLLRLRLQHQHHLVQQRHQLAQVRQPVRQRLPVRQQLAKYYDKICSFSRKN